MPPDFDQQAREIVQQWYRGPYSLHHEDEIAKEATALASALRAAYRAGIERGAQHLEQRAGEIEKTGSVESFWMARIYRDEAVALQGLEKKT